jgi:hypothetical protein
LKKRQEKKVTKSKLNVYQDQTEYCPPPVIEKGTLR